jgi:hypothetical protein
MNEKKGMRGKMASSFKSFFLEFNCGFRLLIKQAFGEVAIMDA